MRPSPCSRAPSTVTRRLRAAARRALAGPLPRRPRRGGGQEILVEPVLESILEAVLDFPRDGYFRQLRKGGIKPDFTPHDLIAHSFVLDAKSSNEKLAAHEPQIRKYMQQRSLDFGVLFNLRELRVYRKGGRRHDESLSFPLL